MWLLKLYVLKNNSLFYYFRLPASTTTPSWHCAWMWRWGKLVTPSSTRTAAVNCGQTQSCVIERHLGVCVLHSRGKRLPRHAARTKKNTSNVSPTSLLINTSLPLKCKFLSFKKKIKCQFQIYNKKTVINMSFVLVYRTTSVQDGQLPDRAIRWGEERPADGYSPQQLP